MLSRSLKKKIVVSCGAILGFCLLYEATTLDSRYAAEQALGAEASLPAPGPTLRFSATAYCRGETTTAGTEARAGVAAADPAVLPVGSVVRIEVPDPRYTGIYTVMDTGPNIQGREVDLYMWNCDEAVRFGRQSVQLHVLRLGWNPQATGARAGRLFNDREAETTGKTPTPQTATDAPPRR